MNTFRDKGVLRALLAQSPSSEGQETSPEVNELLRDTYKESWSQARAKPMTHDPIIQLWVGFSTSYL